jgi:serine/threonine-protein kinase
MADDPQIGTILNQRYRVTALLGRGAMGIVFRGEHLQLGKPVAIKFLRDLFFSDDSSMARFECEAQAMSKLSHPHCVSVIDYGFDVWPYIVMDYVAGASLQAWMNQEPVAHTRAIRLTLQILAGLAHAHGQGIIHRDIKPENIIVNHAAGTGEHARIVDFSLAKMVGGSGTTMTGAILGTPAYMSPEQAIGLEVDARTDLYSVGVILFELLTRHNPFQCPDIHETLLRQREMAPPSLGKVAQSKTFSIQLESILRRALAKRREDRFPSAVEFIGALSGVPEAGDLSDVLGTQHLLRFSDAVETVNLPPSQENVLLKHNREEAATMAPHHGKRTRNFLLFGGIALLSVLVFAILVTHRSSSPQETIAAKEESPNHSTDQIDSDETSLANAKRLIADGQKDLAIEMLQQLRLSHPRVAEIPYLLANLFAEKKWWSDAVSRYEIAIALEPEYKKDPTLNRNVILALSNDKTFGSARALIVDQIGLDAIPHLKNALKNEPSLQVRRRAAKILTELTEMVR